MLNQSVKPGVHPTTFAQIFTKNVRLALCLPAQYWVEAARREQKTNCPEAWRQTLPQWPGNRSALLSSQIREHGDIIWKLKLSSAKSCLDTRISSSARNGPKRVTSVACWSGKEEHGKEWWGKGNSSHFTQCTKIMSLLFCWLTASVLRSSSHSLQSQMLFPIYILPLKK